MPQEQPLLLADLLEEEKREQQRQQPAAGQPPAQLQQQQQQHLSETDGLAVPASGVGPQQPQPGAMARRESWTAGYRDQLPAANAQRISTASGGSSDLATASSDSETTLIVLIRLLRMSSIYVFTVCHY